MKRIHVTLALMFLLLISFTQTEGKGWSKYKHFSSHEGVNYYYKVKYYKSGKSKVKWKVENTNSYKVMAGFKEKRYTLADGTVRKVVGEGWFVKPRSEYSFIADPLLNGRVVDIQITMIVKKE